MVDTLYLSGARDVHANIKSKSLIQLRNKITVWHEIMTLAYLWLLSRLTKKSLNLSL